MRNAQIEIQRIECFADCLANAHSWDEAQPLIVAFLRAEAEKMKAEAEERSHF